MTSQTRTYELVVVSNRLPVDSQVGPDGSISWVRSPGGLVTALESVTRDAEAAWVGWPGSPDIELEPFDADGMRLVPVPLTEIDLERYYEGFSNASVWPLYHDVIAVPEFHREWWERYVAVNERFAEAAAAVAADGATVWIQDYQLQLVPRLLRSMRPDLAIGFFLHIPFPPYGLFSQLPWRGRIVDGLLGADVVGFQRASDAANFATAVRRLTDSVVRAQHRGSQVEVADAPGAHRIVVVKSFPISIDAAALEALARTPGVQARAREIRESLGADRTLFLGVDRLDYTKGILHRLKAYGELLRDGLVDVDDVALIQIAVPSRERVAAYAQLRDEVELMAGRINGDFQTLRHRAVSYHYHTYPREEMAAMFLAADVLLVTALRDGMNLVAKEYVATRFDEDGVLLLSEFTGAADELRRAVLVNPHDIAGLKDAMLGAMRMPRPERRSRMRAMRRRVAEHDVARWSSEFLDALEQAAARSRPTDDPHGANRPVADVVDGRTGVEADATPRFTQIPEQLTGALREFARKPQVLVALDFDGTLAPEVDEPAMARALPEARQAVLRLAAAPRTRVVLISGRSIEGLEEVTEGLPESIFLVGSHGAEIRLDAGMEFVPLEAGEQAGLKTLGEILEDVADRHEAVWLERKPAGFALHTRLATEENSRIVRLVAIQEVEDALPGEDVVVRDGRTTLEFAIRGTTKGDSIEHLRRVTGSDAVFFAGDDVTDEDAFAALGPDDVGLKSGPGQTIANFRVAGPAEIALALHRLADFREGDVHEQWHWGP
ncbi:MAG TPA: bifunctional alpha,alpha-trehalose-phosphate synthase (UDP-forming)/trehalose-phosphatase [Microbacteriaceae bacterium]|nr:bifunctional alpha,alpha-trehalose-phosphate synthase (UDP-forming)/trehalose-phosphatase [Microbacteriaceae bacterium]